MPQLSLTATTPIRLDRLLQGHLGKTIGRRRLAAMLAAGDVRVNGRPAAKGTLVRPGDEIVVHALPAPESRLTATPGALVTPYLDAHLVVVDKPPGMPSLGGVTAGPSVASTLLALFPEMAEIDHRRSAGLVHRIDTGTSGLLLAARHPETYRRLRREFERKAVEKHYLAVVRGSLSQEGRIELPLRRQTRSRMAPARAGDAGWPAMTAFTPLNISGDLTLLHLSMRTGVTHQLRVHLAALGHPILGDERYGPSTDRAPEDLLTTHPWHYLHAHALRFDAADLPCPLVTAFPAHWIPLCERLGWPTQLPANAGGRP